MNRHFYPEERRRKGFVDPREKIEGCPAKSFGNETEALLNKINSSITKCCLLIRMGGKKLGVAVKFGGTRCLSPL